MTTTPDVPPPPSGLTRWIRAFANSGAGFRSALKHEAAVRQELAALVVLVPVAVYLPVTAPEKLVLVGSMLLVLIVELLNSAIEATVDRISLERHPLSGRAKDMGSAAVLTSLLFSVVCWVVIAGPLVVAKLK